MTHAQRKKSHRGPKKSSQKKIGKRKARKQRASSPKEIHKREWYLFDGSKEPLGRLSVRVAKILIGKHKVSYAPHLDCGDFAVVVNADKVYLTGKKMDQKVYYHHTGYPQGLRKKSFREILRDNPKDLVYRSVKGMLPNNSLRVKMLRRLRIHTGTEHPHKNKVKEFKL